MGVYFLSNVNPGEKWEFFSFKNIKMKHPVLRERNLEICCENNQKLINDISIAITKLKAFEKILQNLAITDRLKPLRLLENNPQSNLYKITNHII